ncbi:peptidoglycan-binding domain-containing protein [Tropicibacter oceani]|uniref:Peptidoglycan-binding domain-containing protein n=1 Tax=Tropicibacter oceani TaxID=3058420 RepID=A0ABY8QJ56_9RHOB|nr:peptidoglycan-binding domain-containing protein [Tropicibacter oceani]WGW04051.1 peptidoglycan-binding domain-containing protein [Tropicibacter oceani]
MRLMTLTLAGLLAGSGAAQAAGDALIIGNSRYGAVQSFFGAARVVAAADSLRDAGLDVTAISDADGQAMDEAFGQFFEGIEAQETPLIIVLAGTFMHGPSGAYLLPVDDGQSIDASEIMTRAFPLDAALDVLAAAPGRSFLVLGETASDVEAGPFLKAGLGQLDAPQGVTIIRGLAPDVAAYAIRDMTRPDVRVALAAQTYELTVEGFDPPWQVVLRKRDITPPKPGETATDGPDPLAAEQADNAAWRLAQQADSAEGYQTYLDGFSRGLHASAAKQRLAAIRAEPYYAERRAEEALALSRDARRDIQRDLSILGFNTRGIDGIFGPGTRGAIKQWQTAERLRPSGYLDQSQIGRLDADARARAAELEAEAERRAAELERQDHLLWRQVQGRGDEASLRGYLDAYPDGLHAPEARRLLAQIEDQRAGTAALQDRRAWDQARSVDSIAAYRQYLAARPGGAFAGQAQARIEELNREETEARAIARAQAEEEALNLNPVARKLAETRLKQLGLKPGDADGVFDKRTRRAIWDYQKSRGLTVSGYLDEQTVVRLLADGILGR